jgi:hypothetical protein
MSDKYSTLVKMEVLNKMKVIINDFLSSFAAELPKEVGDKITLDNSFRDISINENEWNDDDKPIKHEELRIAIEIAFDVGRISEFDFMKLGMSLYGHMPGSFMVGEFQFKLRTARNFRLCSRLVKDNDAYSDGTKWKNEEEPGERTGRVMMDIRYDCDIESPRPTTEGGTAHGSLTDQLHDLGRR